MRPGRWFGYSVRQISRALGGTVPEATLRRWATDAEATTSAILVDITDRDAILFARVYAAAAGLDMHPGTTRALADHLLRLTPLPTTGGWLTLTHTPADGTHLRWHPTSTDLAAHLTRATTATTVIPIPAIG